MRGSKMVIGRPGGWWTLPNGESASHPRIPSAQSLDLGDQLRNARGPDFVVCAAWFVFG
jgi:hypothetical protein